MSIFKGSATLTRYQVQGDTPPDFWGFLDRRIRANVFHPIDDQPNEQMSVGWCSVHDFLDTSFTYASYALDPYVVLGLRVDTRKIPTAQVRRELQRELRRAGQEGRVLSRVQREELRERVAQDLMRRTPPATQVFEVVWDTAKGEVWLGTGGRGVRDLFEGHFRRSFDLGLWPRLPWLLAQDLLPAEDRLALDMSRPQTLYHGEA